jgi:Carboxyl transferase domain
VGLGFAGPRMYVKDHGDQVVAALLAREYAFPFSVLEAHAWGGCFVVGFVSRARVPGVPRDFFGMRVPQLQTFLRGRVQVEMYADTTARGGVLEPEGIVEIKFRTPDLLAAMHRLDPVILKLKKEGGQEAAIKAREQLLLPVYRQVCPGMSEAPMRLFAHSSSSAGVCIVKGRWT